MMAEKLEIFLKNKDYELKLFRDLDPIIIPALNVLKQNASNDIQANR